jgi:hypothetical protein
MTGHAPVTPLHVVPAEQHHARPGTTTPAGPVSTPACTQTGDKPRPGSRADRLARPLARDVLRGLAEHHGVCVRPLAIRRIDKETGRTEVIDVPCGARLASKCKPCAERNRRLRQQQIREGWHLTDEPAPPVEAPDTEVRALVGLRCTYAFERDERERAADWDQVADLDQAITQTDELLSTMRIRGGLDKPAERKKPRRTRSTRRRKDAGQLPRHRVDPRTVGRVYTGNDGRSYQPSTLLTVTLDSYGPVHSGARTKSGWLRPCSCGQLHGQQDPLLGVPIDPAGYDYRRAALDAVFFAATLDRFWQNLRRAAGSNVQYAGSVEMQKRLTPHAHYAMRGTLPRALLRQVAAGTYHQVWWPHFNQPVYPVNRPPVWDTDRQSYVDSQTDQPLTTWATAIDQLSTSDTEPAYVARLGRIDARGITAGTRDAAKSIRYVTKYVTKDITEQADPHSPEQQAHLDRLHAELATLPCSPTCANWLLYGIQPDKAKPGLNPGHCSGKVHQRHTLGFTGRRVLISRQWSGKTLADHRADNQTWIRTVLAGALADDEQPREPDDQVANDDRYYYQLANPDDPDVPTLQVRIMRSIAIRDEWRRSLHQATAPPGTGTIAVPATQDQQPAALAA